MLVLGGGDEAEDKSHKLMRVGARVTVVAERACSGVARAAQRRELHWFARRFVTTDLFGTRVVILTDPDEHQARELRALQRSYPFWLCAVDQPDYSDFSLVSIVRRGPLQIGISTGGGAPLLSRRIRQGLEAGLDQRFGEFARSFADLRAELRALPKAERARRLADALDGFAMDVQVSYPREEE